MLSGRLPQRNANPEYSNETLHESEDQCDPATNLKFPKKLPYVCASKLHFHKDNPDGGQDKNQGPESRVGYDPEHEVVL